MNSVYWQHTNKNLDTKEELLMSIVNKKAFDLISECAESDSYNTDSIFDSDVKLELDGLYADIKREIDKDCVVYSKESIPVLQIDDCDDSPFCVELDMLAKYMDTNSLVDIDQAVADIAEANNIAVDNLYVLIESEEDALEYLEESKKLKKATGSKKKLGGIFNTATVLRQLKTKGIKVAKKSNKKKSKSKK